ncbi:MAG: hypothetical protein ACFCVK_17185 [Acidimicrobiales bacterium]
MTSKGGDIEPAGRLAAEREKSLKVSDGMGRWDYMTEPAVIDLTSRLDAARYQVWLERAARRTSHPGVRRLIADVSAELRALGPVDRELESVVLGALASVAAALDVERLRARRAHPAAGLRLIDAGPVAGRRRRDRWGGAVTSAPWLANWQPRTSSSWTSSSTSCASATTGS